MKNQSTLELSDVKAIAAAAEPLARPPQAPGVFANAANTDFTIAAHREQQRAALENYTATKIGKKWPVIINGKKIADRPYLPSVNPAHPTQVVGYWAKGTVQDADDAVAASVAYFPQWRASHDPPAPWQSGSRQGRATK